MVRLASVLALALVALAGCASRAQTPVVASGTPNCDYGTPPGEMQMTYETKTDSATTASKGDVASSYRPNAQERPKAGAVHAAVN